MTRVLMIAPTPFFSDRGCHVRIYEEAVELRRRGIEVKVVTYPLGNDLPNVDLTRCLAVVPYRRAEAGPSWRRLPLDAAVLASTIRQCRTFRPDIIHAHLHEGAAIGAVLKKIYRLPLIFDYQGSLVGETVQHGFLRRGGSGEQLLSRVEMMVNRAADIVVTSSRKLTESLASRGQPAVTLTDGIDPERFRPGRLDAALARSLGLADGEPTCVYLGVMSDYQGVDVLLHAAEDLRSTGERVRFLLMGYPETKYREEASRRRLDGLVTFTGRIGYFDAPRYLRLGTIALAPKLADTEANGKVLTYMASGLPVVAFDQPVNRELLGETAEWAPVTGDRRELGRSFSRAIRRLLHDPERCRALGAAGRDRAERQFSVSGQGEQLVALYQGLRR